MTIGTAPLAAPFVARHAVLNLETAVAITESYGEESRYDLI